MPSTEAPPVESPAPDEPRPDGRRTDTRDRLVQSALRMFSEHGYARTTVAEIERSVGLRPGGGGLYRHFSSKDDLLLEAVRGYGLRVTALRRDLAERNEAVPATSLADDLRHLVLSLAGFLSGEGPMVRLSLDSGGLPEPVRHAVGAAWDEGYGMLADLLVRHGVERSAATVLSVSALGSLDHYFTHIGAWHRQPAGLDPAEFVTTWVDQVGTLTAAHLA